MSEAVQDHSEAVTINVTAENMLGDLLSALLTEIKLLPRPWEAIPAEEQGEVLDRLTRRVEQAIRQAVTLIWTDDRPCVTGVLESLTFKKEVKAVVQVARHLEDLHRLTDSIGMKVLIVVADASHLMGGKDQVKPSPDQKDLALEQAATDAIKKAAGEKPVDGDEKPGA